MSSLFLAAALLFSAAVRPTFAQNPPILDPNKTPYPRASLHDFSDLVPAPGGQKGFLTAKGDHFYWQDGTRAKFWGINVANTSLQESDADIAAMLKNFRAAGFNLVRLHHFDERGGIIDLEAKDSRQFVVARIKKLDYWIAKARENGIYVYLDLLDYRKFKVADGVANPDAIGRSAKPYAVFDPRLIELQQEYARKLMREHINQYTGLAYADDPAVVMLEIYDENGLFMRRGLWRSMPAPYAQNFKKLWNEWLKNEYGTTAKLRAAWTDDSGKSALFAKEMLEIGGVEVPAMTWTPNQVSVADRPYSALARRSDGARFAAELHRRYFRQMKGFLRGELQIKVPLCATGRYDDLPDLSSQAAELDFIGCNFYYDHPYWGKNAKQWQLPSYFHNKNPLSDVGETSMAAATGLARVQGKPFVVREWNYCWPNKGRAAGMLEAAAYAAFHDIDAMILFVYETNKSARVSYFNVRSDPARWGMAALGAQIYLGNLIAPATHKIVVPYGPIDTFTYTKYHNPFYAMGWTTRVENDFFSGKNYLADGKTSLIVPPGRSSIGQYSGAPALLYGGLLNRDLSGKLAAQPDFLGDYGITARTKPLSSFVYDGLVFDALEVPKAPVALPLPLDRVHAVSSRPVGTNEANNAAHGFLDMGRKRLVFGSLGRAQVLRAALDALQVFQGVPNDHANTVHNVFRADTGEIFRDAALGRLILQAPQVQALCGNLTGLSGISGGLGVANAHSGALVAVSLDGKPLVRSERYVIKMVTDARNLDEGVARDPRFLRSSSGQWKLSTFGRGPVTTRGKASAQPVQISLGGETLLSVFLEGGSFELYVDGKSRQFYCDTPGVRFNLGAAPKAGAKWKVVSAQGFSQEARGAKS
ncbi:beta-galactosidase [Abditibacterium utsteinense]|uniref:beta-galactosidase n=1 Tax=Abditibacterium utsteinense TaxID=1960156 RepID=UPI000D08BCFC|nr:beta-galactosidase [Abditibacterium utsteinense]